MLHDLGIMGITVDMYTSQDNDMPLKFLGHHDLFITSIVSISDLRPPFYFNFWFHIPNITIHFSHFYIKHFKSDDELIR